MNSKDLLGMGIVLDGAEFGSLDEAKRNQGFDP